MALEIRIIRLSSVNCYLVKNTSGFFLIDTGMAGTRANLEKELEQAGCNPDNLRLIVITHGDSDHSGNGAYLQEKFGTKIAIHPDESKSIESGNFLASRNANLTFLNKILLGLIKPFFALRKADRFKADVFLKDGYNLLEWGLDAAVLHIPGHSRGSIGVLTDSGELFCGDLMSNDGQPRLHFVDELEAAKASVEKLRMRAIKVVYPGHGKSFTMEEYFDCH